MNIAKSREQGIIDSRWVHRRKPDGIVRSRLVRRGFNEVIESRGDVYAATPTFRTFKLILSHGLNSNYVMYVGDVSTAFLRASVIQPAFVSPPEDYQSESGKEIG